MNMVRPIIWSAVITCYLLMTATASGKEAQLTTQTETEVFPGNAYNVILISLDTLRADYVGIYGNPDPTTPFLDTLFSRSVWFKDCIVQAPWTLASHMSLLTSQYPNVHNVNIAKAKLPEGKLTLAMYLKEFGMHTQGIISNPFLGGGFGFDRGFDGYNDAGKHHGFQSTREFSKWVNKNYEQNQPFFLFLHYNDPHMPYQAPTPYYKFFDREYSGKITGSRDDIVKYVRRKIHRRDLQHIRSLYSEEIRYMDHQLQRVFGILRKLGLYEESMVIITADHGEEFKEHGKLEHNQTLYEELLRSPLMIKFPQNMDIEPQMIDRQVKNIDIMPTILETLDLPIPEDSVQGVSLLPLIMGSPEADEINKMVFSESANTHKVSVRGERWKYIYNRQFDRGELYDLINDPGEKQNLVKMKPDLAMELQQLAQDYMTQAESGWHIRSHFPFEFKGVLKTSGRFVNVTEFAKEMKDTVELSENGNEMKLDFFTKYRADKFDGVDFDVIPSDAEIKLFISESNSEEKERLLKKIYIGRRYETVEQNPIVLNGPDRFVDPTAKVTDVIVSSRYRKGKRPGIYIWKLGEEEQKVQWADIDEDTRNRLESLGYFR